MASRDRTSAPSPCLPYTARKAIALLTGWGCSDSGLRAMLDLAGSPVRRASPAALRSLATTIERTAERFHDFLTNSNEGNNELLAPDGGGRAAAFHMDRLVQYASRPREIARVTRRLSVRDSVIKLQFLSYVRVRTGQWRDAEVADVIRHVLRSERNCTGSGLKMFRVRHRSWINAALEQQRARRPAPEQQVT